MRAALADLRDQLLGRRDPLIPPRRLAGRVGDSDYAATGEAFLALFQGLGGLGRGDRVLDIGCGSGRMARPLTALLEPPGSYHGFDPDAALVDWCTRNITVRHPHFSFRHIDLHNAEYNPAGTISGRELRFPYEDAAFDFAFATSVFTHLRWAEAQHYLEELARVLAPGGAALLTFFLLDAESASLIAAGRSTLAFTHRREGYATTDPAVPERAIAFECGQLIGELEHHGLRLRGGVHNGSWSGRADALSYQDVVVVEPAR